MDQKISMHAGMAPSVVEDKLGLDGVSQTGARMSAIHGEVSQPSPLLVQNLLNSLVDLAALLPGEVERSAWLNAYLLAAGMNQIVEDELHPDPLLLGKAVKYLGRIQGPAGFLAASAARLTASSLLVVRSWGRQTRRLTRFQRDLARLVQLLANKVVFLQNLPESSHERLLALAQELVASVDEFPERIQRTVLRLPSCFRSFDQHPDDLRSLAEKYFRCWPERERTLVVVGLRTSGSYLAPLLGAALKLAGAHDVQVLTLRPGRGLTFFERSLLRAAVAHNGQVLVTDDSPTTGGSLSSAVRDLEQVGVDPERIVLLLQLFGTEDSLPRVLSGFKTVLLPWEDWSVQNRFQTAKVRQTLGEFWAPEIQVEGVELLPLPARRWDRSHAHARFRVSCLDVSSGSRFERQVFVKGEGLGYFGQHSLAIAQALPGYLPEIYGFRDGLLYRQWIPEGKRLIVEENTGADAFIQAAAAYTTERSRALAVARDLSLGLFGQRPVWEVTSNLLSQAFGRAWMLARPALVDRLVKRLLQVNSPSVVDGSMDQFRWFEGQDQAHLVKIDPDERDFCNLDLYCYDPVYDLAGAALELHEQALVEQLRAAFTRLSGIEIDEERWLLYSLVHVWDRRRTQDGHDYGWSRGFSGAVQEYFAALYFSDLDPVGEGGLCALDIDGVLETNILGFPSLSPDSAMALRALKQHAYRPVLATGRSLNDVKERCRIYRLPGGVAEYGAVVHNQLTGETFSLLTEHHIAALDQLRVALSEIPGVILDPDYHFAVRAFRFDENGRRRGLAPGTISEAVQQAHLEGRIRAIRGDSQTDFMVTAIDKSGGLRMLASQLGGPSRRQDRPAYVFAIGDTLEDLPMLLLAERAAAPAHADLALQRFGVRIFSRPYQAGLAQAVERLLGHRLGACPVCQGPNLSSNAKLLLRLFATQERGTSGMFWNALALASGLLMA
jgi:hydroxymethylpyrimidine pyrophosphatase-like HAD family hydrolase